MTSVSSSLSGGSLYSTSLSSLDTNGDGIISAEELAAADKSSGTQRTQDPTVENENAASGVSSQVAGGVMAMLLANAGGQTDAQAEDRPSAADLFARIDADGDGKVTEDDDTVSLFDVLEEMKRVIAAYSAFAEQQESEAEEPSGIKLSI